MILKLNMHGIMFACDKGSTFIKYSGDIEGERHVGYFNCIQVNTLSDLERIARIKYNQLREA
jgi:hypothetical protein